MNHYRMQISTISLVLVAMSGLAWAQDSVTHFTAQDGTQVTLVSGQPQARDFGPVPPFAQLDTDHNGWISRSEASNYLPLFNDYDFISHHADRISKRQFEHWNRTQNP